MTKLKLTDPFEKLIKIKAKELELEKRQEVLLDQIVMMSIGKNDDGEDLLILGGVLHPISEESLPFFFYDLLVFTQKGLITKEEESDDIRLTDEFQSWLESSISKFKIKQ